MSFLSGPHRSLLLVGRFFAVILLCSVAVGLVISAFAWVLTFCEHKVQYLMGWPHKSSLSLMPGYALHHAWIALIPAVGGLAVGLFMHFVAPAAKGYGVPEVMARIEAQGGKIPPHFSIFTFISPIITIGSNGSAGPEGPSIAIGAALASGIAHSLSLTKDQRKVLVACGAAAGLAALFNASLVGAFFAMEVLLGEMNPKKFALVATATVTGKLAAVHDAIAGHIFSTAKLPALTHTSTVLAFGLGILSAPAAIGCMWVFHAMPKLFKRIPVKAWLKPAIGGLIVGVVGLLVPQILGEGQDVIQQLLLAGSSSVFLLLLIALLKPITTSITLGSGGVGGIFLPSIFIGTAIGATYGALLHHWGRIGIAPAVCRYRYGCNRGGSGQRPAHCDNDRPAAHGCFPNTSGARGSYCC